MAQIGEILQSSATKLNGEILHTKINGEILPFDLLVVLFAWLMPNEACACARTCSWWRAILARDAVLRRTIAKNYTDYDNWYTRKEREFYGRRRYCSMEQFKPEYVYTMKRSAWSAVLFLQFGSVRYYNRATSTFTAHYRIASYETPNLVMERLCSALIEFNHYSECEWPYLPKTLQCMAQFGRWNLLKLEWRRIDSRELCQELIDISHKHGQKRCEAWLRNFCAHRFGSKRFERFKKSARKHRSFVQFARDTRDWSQRPFSLMTPEEIKPGKYFYC